MSYERQYRVAVRYPWPGRRYYFYPTLDKALAGLESIRTGFVRRYLGDQMSADLEYRDVLHWQKWRV